MRLFHFDTTAHALEGLLHSFIFSQSLETKKFAYWTDVTMVVHEPRSTLDLNQLGMRGSTRWERFLREYSDIGLHSFISSSKTLEPWEEISYSCPVIAKHKQGNCLLGLSVRRSPIARVTMYSRVSTLLPTGAVDLSFGSLVCEAVSDLLNLPVSLVWHLGQLQCYALESLPAIIQTGQLGAIESSSTQFARMLRVEHLMAINGKESAHHRTARFRRMVAKLTDGPAVAQRPFIPRTLARA